MFLSPEVFRTYMLPFVFKELVIVADRFHIRPLLPLLSATDGIIFWLSVQNKVRLLQGTHYSVNEVSLADVPKNLAETLRMTIPGKSSRCIRAHQEGRAHFRLLRMGLRLIARRTSSDTFGGLIRVCMNWSGTNECL